MNRRARAELTENSPYLHQQFTRWSYESHIMKRGKQMGIKAPRPGILRTIRNYLSKIVVIFRTRNIYGYNSVCMRILVISGAGTRRYGKA
jgi:hypothetical protein